MLIAVIESFFDLYFCSQQMNIIKIALLLISVVNFAQTRPEGLAVTPPLILTPRTQPCQTDEFQILRQADMLMTEGFASKGYKYILIEPCWQGQRDKKGKIQQDLNKFPSGLSTLIQQLHSRNLLVGLTIDIGTETACGKIGSQGFESLDAMTYASWGVDYIKIENSHNIAGSRQRMTLISQFIQRTGKRIMISIDNGGKQGVQTWGKDIANTWRTIENLNSNWQSLVSAIDRQAGLQIYSREGAWNDAGILLSQLPQIQFISQYLVWICIKSPLLLTSLQSFSKDKLKILQNTQLLAIHQDSLKEQGKLIVKEYYPKGWQYVWGGKLSGNRYVLVFLNDMASQSKMTISLKKDLGINVTSYWIRDPLNQTTIGSSSSDTLIVEKVQSHGAQIRVINL